jgi:hypothetical protein
LVCALGASPSAYAEPRIELSGSTGFGVFVAGVGSGRFAVSPSGSLSVHGERGFLVARDTVSLLGATGGRFGFSNEATLGGGLFWERVNASAGLSLAAFSLPICGPRLCGQVRGFAPGAGVRLDVFGPYLSGGLGVSIDCACAFVLGRAVPVWSGVSVRCSAGPILRFRSPYRPSSKGSSHAFLLQLDRSAPSTADARRRVYLGRPERVLGQPDGRHRRRRYDPDRQRGRRKLR